MGQSGIMDLSRREYLVFIILLGLGSVLVSYAAGKVFKKKDLFLPLLIFLNSFFLHIFYISYTDTWVRQHDVIGFGNRKGIGQAALIEYLLNEGKLPDFDPTTRWGFFQPLLHHIIAAAALKISLLRGMNFGRACENLQILTLIYSMVFIFYGFRILALMGLKGKALYLSEALLAFHPVLILLSGSINNDMLSHMFLVMAVYYVLKWQREDRLTDLLLTALFTGLSMMSKLSGVLIAPAVAFLMINRLISDRKERDRLLKRIGEYTLFALIVFPCGLFFPLRNLILFSVPLTFMPEVGEDLSGYSLFQRFADIRTATPYACMIKNGNPYDEFNIFLMLIKTGLTGEYDYSVYNPYITPFAWLLFISGSILFITVSILFILHLRGKLIKEVPIRRFWSILILTGIFFQLRLMIAVPNFSSGDIRYIAWIILPAALLIGLKIQSGRKLAAGFIYPASGVFIISSAAVYYLLGLP